MNSQTPIAGHEKQIRSGKILVVILVAAALIAVGGSLVWYLTRDVVKLNLNKATETAKSAMAAGDFKKARRVLERAMDDCPDRPDRQELLAEPIRILEEATAKLSQKRAHDAQAQQNRGHALSAQIALCNVKNLLSQRQFEMARRLATRGLEEYGSTSWAGEFSDLLKIIDEESERARLSMARTEAEKMAAHERHLRYRSDGIAAFNRKDYKAAVEAYQRALGEEEDADTRLLLEEALAKTCIPSLAVVEFKIAGDVGGSEIGTSLAELLLGKFSSERFQLAERTELRALVDERDLVLAGLIDNPQLAKGLKLGAVRYLVVGNVARLGNFVISARLVDVMTGNVIQSADACADDLLGLQESLDELARVLQMSNDEKRSYLEQRRQDLLAKADQLRKEGDHEAEVAVYREIVIIRDAPDAQAALRTAEDAYENAKNRHRIEGAITQQAPKDASVATVKQVVEQFAEAMENGRRDDVMQMVEASGTIGPILDSAIELNAAQRKYCVTYARIFRKPLVDRPGFLRPLVPNELKNANTVGAVSTSSPAASIVWSGGQWKIRINRFGQISPSELGLGSEYLRSLAGVIDAAARDLERSGMTATQAIEDLTTKAVTCSDDPKYKKLFRVTVSLIDPTLTSIEQLEPRSGATFIAGRPIHFVTKVLHPRGNVTLRVSRNGGRTWLQEDVVAMTPSTKEPNQYEADWVAAAEDGIVGYRVICGDAMSVLQQLVVLPAPAIKKLDCSLVGPAYTRRGSTSETTGHITALVGTEVTVKAYANLPVEKASLVFEDSKIAAVKMVTSDNKMVATFSVTRNTRYRIAFDSTRKGIAGTSIWYEIETVDDQPPRVRIESPAGKGEYTADEQLEINGQVSDDYGISNLVLVYEVDGISKSVELSSYDSPGVDRKGIEVKVPVSKLGKPGSTVKCHLEARDFRPIGGGVTGQVGKSGDFTVSIKK